MGKHKVYLFGMGGDYSGNPIEALVTSGSDIFQIADDGKQSEPSKNAFSTSFTIEGIVACPEIVRMMKDMSDRCFFSRKEMKRMRHFVTHGYDIWLKYQQGEGKRTIDIAHTPRELRLLLEKIHYVRTDWFANRKVKR